MFPLQSNEVPTWRPRAIATTAVRQIALGAWCLLNTIHGTAAAAGGGVDIETAFAFAPPAAHQRNGEVVVLGAIDLESARIDGHALHGLSGLAWNADEDLLYAVSDEGYLVWLRPRIAGGQMTGVRVLARFPLRDAAGEPLQPPMADAEDLALTDAANGRAGDTELTVSFEHRVRLARYSPEGALLGPVALPPALADQARYAHPNQALEALARHPRYGLLTGPEYPLANAPRNIRTLYTLGGSHWNYAPAEIDGALVGLAVMPDGALLELERRYVSPWQPLVISLRRLELDDDRIRVTPVARFSSADGWAVDNFEGVTHHIANRYFIVSDDNASPLQRTLLVYLAIRAPVQPDAPP